MTSLSVFMSECNCEVVYQQGDSQKKKQVEAMAMSRRHHLVRVVALGSANAHRKESNRYENVTSMASRAEPSLSSVRDN
jgi:hypothetical protein